MTYPTFSTLRVTNPIPVAARTVRIHQASYTIKLDISLCFSLVWITACLCDTYAVMLLWIEWTFQFCPLTCRCFRKAIVGVFNAHMGAAIALDQLLLRDFNICTFVADRVVGM